MAVLRVMLRRLLRKKKHSTHTAVLTSVRSASSLYLFDLPQELLDMIIGYAIPRFGDFKIIFPFEWDCNEIDNRKRHGKSYITRPFPAPVVDRFLVSKRYFLNAAKVFIGDRAFRNPRDFYKRNSSPHYNIVMRFMQRAKIEIFSVNFICGARAPETPMLTEVIINLDPYYLDCFKTKFPWEEEFGDDHFNFLARKYGLKCLSKIKKYRFEFGPFQVRELQAENDMWELNARKFEEYVRRYVGSFKVKTRTSGFNIEAGFPSASTTASESDKTAHTHSKSGTGSGGEMQSGMSLTQLPDTAEEMIELLKNKGGEVMGLLGALKDEEKAKHNMQDPCVVQ